MAKRDFYEVLGVARDASAEDIRAAHRRLVRKLHPDVNKAPDAAAKFSEVQEAYDVLSDDEKRSLYDRFGPAGLHAGAGTGGPRGTGPEAAWSNIDPETFESIFGDVFGGGFGRGAGTGGGGGGFGGFGRRATGAQPERGPDLEHTLTIGFVTAARGGEERIRLSDAQGETQSIDVRIPAGIESGTRLRLRGKGHPGRRGGQAGDLILTIEVAPHPWLQREGLDLSLELPITIVEAALGCEVQVPLLAGSAKVRVPPGTGSGAKLRLKGRGIDAGDGRVGDFYAVISVVAPKSVDAEARAALETLGRTLPSPRSGSHWPHPND